MDGGMESGSGQGEKVGETGLRTSMGCAASPISAARELADTKSSGTGRRMKTRDATVVEVASARTLRGLGVEEYGLA